MQKVAIFDIDGTVFRSSLLIEFVEGLIDSGLFQQSVRKEYEREFLAWANREGSYEDYISRVVEVYMENIKGIFYGDFMETAEKVVEAEGKKVYCYTRDLLNELKKDNYYLLAISQSPKSILEGFCKKIGFDKVYGRMYEIGPQERFTGNITDLHLISNKANIVRRACEKENLTLKGSVGVGDTEGDIPFLEMVDKPICFNPNAKLYKHAKQQKWNVVVERKDVVYEL